MEPHDERMLAIDIANAIRTDAPPGTPGRSAERMADIAIAEIKRDHVIMTKVDYDRGYGCDDEGGVDIIEHADGSTSVVFSGIDLSNITQALKDDAGEIVGIVAVDDSDRPKADLS